MLGQQGLGQPNLAAVPTLGKAPTPSALASGWMSPLSRVAQRAILPVSVGLFLVPSPPPAVAQGWQSALNRATTRPQLPSSTGAIEVFYPITTPVVVANLSWQQPLSRAIATNRLNQSWQITPLVPSTPVNFGWYQPLSTATQRQTTTTVHPTSIITPIEAPIAVPTGWYAQLNRAATRLATPSITQPNLINHPIEIAKGWYTQLNAAPISYRWIPHQSVFLVVTPVTATPEPPFVETAAPPVFVRDYWDRDEWGNFIPGAGIRQV